jgi:hypothetical protein
MVMFLICNYLPLRYLSNLPHIQVAAFTTESRKRRPCPWSVSWIAGDLWFRNSLPGPSLPRRSFLCTPSHHSHRELQRLSYDPGHIYVDARMLRIEKSGKISRAVRFCCAPTCSRTVLWVALIFMQITCYIWPSQWVCLYAFICCVHAMPKLIRILRGRDKRFKCNFPLPFVLK